MTNKNLISGILMLILFGFTVSQAQIAGGTFSNWDIQKSINMQSIITNNTVNSVMMSGAMKGKSGSQPRTSAHGQKSSATQNPKINPLANAALGTTTFTNSGSYLMPAVFARNVTKDKADVNEQEQVFREALAGYEQSAREKKFNPNDVARSGSGLITFCLQVFYGEKFNSNQYRSVYKKLKENLESNVEFSKLSDSDKQKMNETSVMLSLMVNAVNTEAVDSGSSAKKIQAQNFASEVFQRFTGVAIDKAYIYPDRVQW